MRASKKTPLMRWVVGPYFLLLFFNNNCRWIISDLRCIVGPTNLYWTGAPPAEVFWISLHKGRSKWIKWCLCEVHGPSWSVHRKAARQTPPKWEFSIQLFGAITAQSAGRGGKIYLNPKGTYQQRICHRMYLATVFCFAVASRGCNLTFKMDPKSIECCAQ